MESTDVKKRVWWEGRRGKEGKKMGLNVACVAGGLRFWAPQTAGGWVSRRLWKKTHAHGLTKAAQGQIKQTNNKIFSLNAESKILTSSITFLMVHQEKTHRLSLLYTQYERTYLFLNSTI